MFDLKVRLADSFAFQAAIVELFSIVVDYCSAQSMKQVRSVPVD